MTELNTQRCSKEGGAARCAILAVLITVFAGCATVELPKTDPAAALPVVAVEPSVPEGPVVTRLTDGREGFIIKEYPTMDDLSRRDFERAVSLMADREFAKAIELLGKVVEQSPGATAPYIDLAIAYRHLDNLAAAEEPLRTALTLVPGHPVASNEYGLLLRRSGRFAEARTVYEQTLTVFPDYHPARRNLGILCELYLQDSACALEQYEIYREANPGDAQVQLWIADLRMRLGMN